jgi:hypothetical protein
LARREPTSFYGGRFGGYGLYLVKGKPVFTYNFLGVEKSRWEGQQPLTPGKHTLEFAFKYNGPGLAKGGTGVLRVDGKDVSNRGIAHTTPVLLTIDETFDIADTRTPVDDARCHSTSMGGLTRWLSSSGRRRCCPRTARPRKK